MNVLARLWKAVGGLAEGVEALAGTVGEANGRLRDRLGLGAAAAEGPLPGEVIDHVAALPAPPKGRGKKQPN